jgi:hypothetical protein
LLAVLRKWVGSSERESTAVGVGSEGSYGPSAPVASARS